MESYSEKAQLAKYKSLFGGSPTKFNRTPAMTFAPACGSHDALSKAKIQNFTKISGSMGKSGYKK